MPLLDRRREEFPGLAAGTYLLSHSQGPMPARARVWLDRYLDLWQGHADSNAWKEEWWELSRTMGDGFGCLLGAPADTVQVQPSASAAMLTVASCLDYAERPRIVTTGLEFPTTEYIWREQERLGARLEIVASRDGIRTPVDELLDRIDDHTSLVVLSHASFRSSHLLDPAVVVERAHRHGARVLVDAYQTAGALPLDVESWGVDFAVGGTIKWLCGGPACGYLYVREDVARQLRPRMTGWIAHAEPFDFAAGRIRLADGARRFAQGTPPVPGLYSAVAGLEIIEEVGVSSIAEESRRRTQALVDFALENELPLKSPRAAAERGATVMLASSDPERLVEDLAARGFFVDARPGVVRVSPHFFNTDEEVEAVQRALLELLRP